MATDSDAESSQPSPNRLPFKTLEGPEISPSKRPKTLALHSRPPSTSTFKDKSKIEDESTADSESNSCGVCLSEAGKAVRGFIDNCDHYFCFVCIMEWAKVESRCPLCKRRFTTIRRPPKEGVFLSERIVNVPVRDQVYHYFGNATVWHSNPYSEVQCSVCHSTADENLLLLCDLCDSAAHTYCVGLGATVPEGDWFCQDCTLLRDEHAKSEMEPNSDNQTCFENLHKMPSPEAHVSIFDIVRESSITGLERPITFYPNRSQLSSPIVPDGGINVADNMTEQGSRTNPTVGHELGARTLSRCRNVHGRIRLLRENWNAFRSGSLSFSSSSVNRRNIVPSGRSAQPHSSSCLSQQLSAQKGSSCNSLPNRCSQDIDKAWKMMDVAKSIRRDRERTGVVHQASKHPLKKVNAWKEADPLDRGTIGSEQHHHYSLEKGDDKNKYEISDKEKQSGVTMTGVPKFHEGLPTTCSLGYRELLSSSKVQASLHTDICHGNDGNLPQENLSNIFNENDGSACLISPVRSVAIASNLSGGKRELHASSSCNAERKGRTGKGIVDGKARSADDAKSEIQSLVKLNLKLLSRDKKLEVNGFKEVARLATHSVLAACGLERPKPGVRSFPSSVCSHNDEVKQLRRSTLMTSSCRECFYVFVKDVVNTILFEKMGCFDMSC